MTKSKIVLLPFPFDDLSSTKVRPVACLTEPIGPLRHVVVAFITSRIFSQSLPTDLVLAAREPGFESTGLRVSSTLQLHRLMTVRTDLIRRELGRLSPETQRQVDQRLLGLFELASQE